MLGLFTQLLLALAALAITVKALQGTVQASLPCPQLLVAAAAASVPLCQTDSVVAPAAVVGQAPQAHITRELLALALPGKEMLAAWRHQPAQLVAALVAALPQWAATLRSILAALAALGLRHPSLDRL
jgi:hypothetical protein